MLRYIGVICIFIFTFYAIFCYERHQKASLLQGEGFLLLLKFLMDELEGYGRPPAECIRDLRCEALCKTSFPAAVEGGVSLSEAYARERERLCLPQGMDAILERAFASFGRGGRREECRRLSSEISRAEPLLDAERAELSRRLRLCRTLAISSAMGLVILLL